MRLGVEAALVEGTLVLGDVEVEDGLVTGVGLAGSHGQGIAVPGFVDLQVNGYAGIDVLAADPEALVELGEALLRDGVFAYLPTLITSDERSHAGGATRVAALGERGAARRSSACTSKGRSSRPSAPARIRRRPRAAPRPGRCSTSCSRPARSA